MAYTTINKSTDYFNTKLYTQNATASHSITGVGHQPDLLWFKDRVSSSRNHRIVDAVRGVGKLLKVDGTNSENTATDTLTSFDSDGFTLGVDSSDYGLNGDSGNNTVVWSWKAGTGQGSSNTDGSINTTYTSVNTTAGFSISSYTGTGSNATVGHGLGVVPKMIIVKKLNGSDSWTIYHASLGATKKINFDTGATGTQSDRWNDTSPTNTVFTVSTNSSVNASGSTYVAYCFAEKTGYSKFGSYTGNGNADGSFIYTGFKPAFVITKRTDGTGNWLMYDNKRIGYNPSNYFLFPHLSNAEDTSNSEWLDLYSNGFKTRVTSTTVNGSGNSYIYMAFGQSIVGSNNVPAVAR